MMAAGLPVIAYAAPGPPMMLPPRYLVGIGDAVAMGDKVVALLRDQAALGEAGTWAKERSKAFLWRDIAQRTGEAYLDHWQRKQSTILKA